MKAMEPKRRLPACGGAVGRGRFGHVRDMDGRMELVWSQRLEGLAERLYRDAEGRLARDPLARVAVVVGHPMRGEWLKEYHLFEREGAGRGPLRTRISISLRGEGPWTTRAS